MSDNYISYKGRKIFTGTRAIIVMALAPIGFFVLGFLFGVQFVVMYS